MPPLIGPAIVERAFDVGQTVGKMDAPARELWQREQAVLFDDLARTPEAAAERRALAEKTLARAAGPFADALRKSGALDDAEVLVNLALQGERLAARG